MGASSDISTAFTSSQHEMISYLHTIDFVEMQYHYTLTCEDAASSALMII